MGCNLQCVGAVKRHTSLEVAFKKKEMELTPKEIELIVLTTDYIT